MKRSIARMLVSLALTGLLWPQCLPAVEAQRAPAPAVVDVAMRPNGVLIGQVLDPQGAAVAKSRVAVRTTDREVTSTVTDAQGNFSVSGLQQGGVYELTAARGQAMYRVWMPGTEPPAAKQGALIVAGGRLVRAQNGGFLWLLDNPLVVAGVVATAVAVPVALHNSEHHIASP